jgi:hypothetical protein
MQPLQLIYVQIFFTFIKKSIVLIMFKLVIDLLTYFRKLDYILNIKQKIEFLRYNYLSLAF